MGPVTQGISRAWPRVRRACGAHGFTLVEILVVIAIIAIAASIAVVAYEGDDGIAVAHEAKRFAGAIEHASARARWRAETLGVSADGTGWQFWRRPTDANRWVPVASDDVLGPHTLPAGIVANPLSYAGQALPPDAIVPLRASGHNDPFAFVVEGKATRIVLSADPLNRVTLQAQAESPP